MLRTSPTGRLKAAGNNQGFQVLCWKVKLSTISETSFQITAVYVSMYLWMLWHSPTELQAFFAMVLQWVQSCLIALGCRLCGSSCCLSKGIPVSDKTSNKSNSSAQTNCIQFLDYATRFITHMKKLWWFCSTLDQRQLLWEHVYMSCQYLLSARKK